MSFSSLSLISLIILIWIGEVVLCVKLGRWFEKVYWKKWGTAPIPQCSPFSAVVWPSILISTASSVAMIYLIVRHLGLPLP